MPTILILCKRNVDDIYVYMLNYEQTRVLPRILSDLGQLSVASAVVPFVVPKFAPDSILTVISGFLFATFFWLLSILSAKFIQNQ